MFLIVLLALVSFTTAHEVCYPPYGCFGDDAPYDHALVQLPESPYEVSTKFLYYTRDRPVSPDWMNPLVPTSPSRVKFSPNKTTVVFTHGYIESKQQWYVQMFIDEILKKEDVNLIFIDWSNGAGFPYHQAYGNVRLVGAQIAYMIQVIRNDTGIDMSRLHFVGFSLGAHVMAGAGRDLRKIGLLVPRLSGLDPAAPYFEYQHIDVRLDPTDAEFVDVIHTDSKTLFINGFGTGQQMGHVDFYPNGGYHQVGCGNLDIGVVQYLACSHYRAVRYFMETINNNCPFYGFPCSSYRDYKNGRCVSCPSDGCPRMGYHGKKPKKTGVKYYLQTQKEFPFCGYHYELGFFTKRQLFADLNGAVTVVITGDKETETITLPSYYYDSGSIEHRIVLLKKDVGNLMHVKVSHNRIIDIWKLIGVTVKPLWTNTEYAACFNKWLNNKDNQANLIPAPISSCTG